MLARAAMRMARDMMGGIRRGQVDSHGTRLAADFGQMVPRIATTYIFFRMVIRHHQLPVLYYRSQELAQRPRCVETPFFSH